MKWSHIFCPHFNVFIKSCLDQLRSIGNKEDVFALFSKIIVYLQVNWYRHLYIFCASIIPKKSYYIDKMKTLYTSFRSAELKEVRNKGDEFDVKFFTKDRESFN